MFIYTELTFWLFMLHQGPHKRNWFDSWEVRLWYIGEIITFLLVIYSHLPLRPCLMCRLCILHSWDAINSCYHALRDWSGEINRNGFSSIFSSRISVPSLGVSHWVVCLHSDDTMFPLRARSLSYFYTSCQGRRCRPGCRLQTNHILWFECKWNLSQSRRGT